MTVVLISTGSVMYFGSSIKKLQDEENRTRAQEIANIVAKDVDIDTVVKFRDMVAKAYDAVPDRISNDYMGTPEYEAYVSQFDYLRHTVQFEELYKVLRSDLNSTMVDCLYLCYLDKDTKSMVYMVDSGANNVCYPGSFDYLRGEDLKVLKDPYLTVENSVINNDIYGDIVGGAQPLLNEDNDVVAYVGVDILMSPITAQRNRILRNTILSVIALSLVLSAVALYVSGQLILKPLDRQKELLEEAEDLKKENVTLARRAQASQKISELTASITSLMDNMPAMTFSKDVENGRYLACNQMFAEYAHKKSPQDVVGHTDAEMFDIVTATHFTDDDKIAIEMDEPYIFREDVPDAQGNMRYLQTTKLKFTDANGRLCLLGMSVDVSELVMVRRENAETKAALSAAVNENLTYSNIARALASDYNFIYYVNLKTDGYSEYSATTGSKLSVKIDRSGEDFFDLSLKNAREIIYEEDVERFCASFSKDKILNAIDKDGRFVTTYRLVIDGVPTYVNMKAVRPEDDDNHIIIGINNINDMMMAKEEAERMKEEQTTYQRIAALSGQYICIYTIDPDTDHFVEYAATHEYSSLVLPKEGDDFFEKTRVETERVVYGEDKKRVISAVTKANILEEVDKAGDFHIKYRLVIDGVPKYVQLNAAMIQEKDGPQLLVGVLDIDARERREQEIAANLKNAVEKANIDALTGAANKHAYVDLETAINGRIDDGSEGGFAVIVCDVNGLKHVNDTLGHKAGDEFIRNACAIISGAFENETVFRIGGDEFAVIANGEAYENIDELMKILHESNKKNKAEGDVVVACGMSRFRPGDKNVEQVFERADALMYENKEELKR